MLSASPARLSAPGPFNSLWTTLNSYHPSGIAVRSATRNVFFDSWQDQRFYLLSKQDRPWNAPGLIQGQIGRNLKLTILFHGNEWSYTSTPPICFPDVSKESFNLSLPHNHSNRTDMSLCGTNVT
jgi:hypothetical protein